MKKILTILALLAIYGCAYSQKKAVTENVPEPVAQDKIKGIGKFKIGETTVDDLVAFSKENKLSILPVTDNDEFLKLKTKENLILDIRVDTTTIEGFIVKKISEASSCPNSKVFYIDEIVISSIAIKKLYLKFYENVLIEINCDYSSEITEAFKLKYGEPKAETKTKKNTCTSSVTGSQLSFDDISYYEYWHNGDITCTAYLGSYRSSYGCNKSYISFIQIRASKRSDELFRCGLAISNRVLQRNEENKKKKLSDF